MSFAFGCSPTAIKVTDPKPEQPFRGAHLLVGVEGGIEQHPWLAQFVEEWSVRTGVVITTLNYPATITTTEIPDVVITRPTAVSEVLTRWGVINVPSELRVRDHPYRWDTLVGVHEGKLSRWNDAVVALPLMGESQLFVFRKTLLANVGAKIPQTWEEVAEVATLLKQKGLPALPPLSNNPLDLEREFYTIAASADRIERTQSDQGGGFAIDDAEADRLFSFQYRLQSSRPRIHEPAFVYAIDTLRKLQSHRASGIDPTEAFLTGKASLGIVTIEQFARLQAPGSKVKGKFGIAPIPGSEFVFDLDQQPIPNPNRIVNRTPYVGWGGLYGMVTTKCNSRDAAWAFLTDFADPNRTEAEGITSAKSGAGPMRLTHVDPRHRHLWLGYDLTSEETDRLIEVLRRNMATTVINYRAGLRIPNQRRHAEMLQKELRQALLKPNEESPVVLNRVATQWEQLWQGEAAAHKQEWVRFGFGLSRR